MKFDSRKKIIFLAGAGVLLLAAALAFSGCWSNFQAKRLVILANENFERGDYATASHLYRQVLKVNPPPPGALERLGLSYFAQQQYAEAAEPLLAWSRAKPESFDAHLYAGMAILRADRDLSAAIEHLQIAARIKPDMKPVEQSVISFGLMMAYCKDKQVAKCQSEYRQARAASRDAGKQAHLTDQDLLVLKHLFDEAVDNLKPEADLSFPQTGLERQVTQINILPNPSFEMDSESWSTFEASASRDFNRSVFGKVALKVIPKPVNSFGGLTIDASELAAPDGQYTWSLFVFSEEANGDNIRLSLYDDITQSNPAEATIKDISVPANSWSRIQITGTFGQGAKLRFLTAASLTKKAFFIDGVQLEKGHLATPYCDGEQPGCTWEGVPHASASLRIVYRQRVESGIKLPDSSQWTAGLWRGSNALTFEPGENLVENPSFETGTTGWLAKGLEIIQETIRSRFGAAALNVTGSPDSEFSRVSYDASRSAKAEDPHTWSIFVYTEENGGKKIRLIFYDDVTKGDPQQATYKDFVVPAYTWTRLQLTGAFSPGAKQRLVSIIFSGQKPLLLDGAQLENRPVATPYCDGDQPGCTWKGKPHTSPSRRSSGVSFFCKTDPRSHTTLLWYRFHLPPHQEQIQTLWSAGSPEDPARIRLHLEWLGGEPVLGLSLKGNDGREDRFDFPGRIDPKDLQWHLVGYAVANNGDVQTFYDGRVTRQHLDQGMTADASPLEVCSVGLDHAEQPGFTGLLARANIFSDALTSETVKNLYDLTVLTGLLDSD